MYCIKLAAWRQILVKMKLYMDHFAIWNPGKGDFVPKLFPHLDGFSRRFVLSMGKPRLRGKDTLSFPNPPLLAECAVRQKLYSARRGRTCSQKSEKQYISLLLLLRGKSHYISRNTNLQRKRGAGNLGSFFSIAVLTIKGTPSYAQHPSW